MSKGKQQPEEASAVTSVVAEVATDGATSPEHLDTKELLAELTRWKDTAQRAQAEFENTKKRLAGQQQAALERAGERVVTGLIPVMDDLEYGIAHAKETGNEMAEGLQAIYAKLEAAFAAEGVTILNPLNESFDHHTAQAVQMVPDTSKPDQTVIQVLQKGYVMGAPAGSARVLRPAMVVVSTT
jgi:molecular chaperone GrpE